jgi:hypothetical protein
VASWGEHSGEDVKQKDHNGEICKDETVDPRPGSENRGRLIRDLALLVVQTHGTLPALSMFAKRRYAPGTPAGN